jgi:hypothetical protein
VYAAPFHNDRSSGPEDGMRKSYDEILRVLDRVGPPQRPPVLMGSTDWLAGPDRPVRSPAADDLIERAMMQRDEPLYVVAIGAATNISSAILAAPQIIARIVVVWLGGNATYWPSASEFNLKQDLHASRILFDCGVPLVHVPCLPVTDHLCTTEAEIDRFVKGRGALGDYLSATYSGSAADHVAYSRAIWDLGPIAWLVNPAWADSVLTPSPILTAERTWSHDPHRHLVREVRYVQRNPIFGDLFRKLEHAAREAELRQA